MNERRKEVRKGGGSGAHFFFFFFSFYLACGWAARYEIASAVDDSLSASASGISMPNSSSRAMTSSTASRESRPRSPEKEAEAVT